MKNIVALENNNKYCGIVNDKGEMRLISKNSNNGSFRNILRLENEIELLSGKVSEKKDLVENEKPKLLINIMEVLVTLLIALLTTNFPLGLSLIANIVSLYLTSKRIKKISNLKKESKDMEYSYRVMSRTLKRMFTDMGIKELSAGMRLSEHEMYSVLSNEKKRLELIYDSSKSLVNYMRNNIVDPIEEENVIYLDREKINEYNHPIVLENRENHNIDDEIVIENKKIFDETLPDLLIYHSGEDKEMDIREAHDDLIKQDIVVERENHDKELQGLLRYSTKEERLEEAKKLGLKK